MSDYTTKMLNEDLENIHYRITIANMIPPIPKSKWKSITIKDYGTIFFNPNIPDVEAVQYYFDKYGYEKGRDYSMRMYLCLRFTSIYEKILTKKGYIKYNNDEVKLIRSDLLDILLNSLIPDSNNTIKLGSPLFNKNSDFDYNKVISTLNELTNKHKEES